MKRRIVNLKAYFLIVIVFIPGLLIAQDFDDDVLDNPVPFDGGVSLLIAAGVGYGIKKALERKKGENTRVE